MWDLLTRLILRQRLIILIVITILTVFMGQRATTLKLQWELPKLLPDNDSTMVAYKEFKKMYGKGNQSFLFGISENPLDNLELFNQWYRLGQSIDKIGGVDTVIAINKLFNVVKDTVNKRFDLVAVVDRELKNDHELDSVRALVYSLPFYEGRLYNKENGFNVMAVSLRQSIFLSPGRTSLVDSVFAEVDKFKEESGITIHYSGMPYIQTMTNRFIKKELRMFIVLVIVVTFVILLFFFRSFTPVLVSLVIVAFGVFWSFGIISLLGYELTILTAIIPPLIIVIGIPNSVYLINRYHSEYMAHGNKVLAISRVIKKIGQATFMTNLTTAIGFLAFIVTESTILVEFGYVAFLNIMALFTLSIFLIPSILSFLPPPKEKETRHLDRKFLKKFIYSLLDIIQFHRAKVYIVTIALIISGLYGLSLIKTTGNLTDDLPKDHTIIKDLRYFEKNFNGVMPFEINIDTKKKGGAMKSSTLKRIDKLEKVFGDYKEFGRPFSIVEGVKFIKQAYYNGNPKKFSLFKGQEKTFIKRYIDNTKGGDSDLFRAYVDSTKRFTRVSIPMVDLGTIQMDSILSIIKPRVDEVFDPAKYKIEFTGPGIVYLKGTTYLVRNLLMSLALAIMVIAIVMAFLFRSLRMIVLSIFVNMIPLLLTGAMMGYFGIPLKPSTILVFSIAFGISIDDTIHFLAKYRQELDMCNWDLRPAVLQAMRETGPSMMYTSIILFFGFSVFDSSQFGGTHALGVLTSITLLIAMIVNLVLLPSILLSLGTRVTTHAFQEPMIEVIDEEEDIDYSGLRIEKDDYFNKKLNINEQEDTKS